MSKTNKYVSNMDEVGLCYSLLSNRLKEKVFIDVGAHFGNAIKPFIKDGWLGVAYEPDPVNRIHLRSYLGGYENLKIRSVALSDHAENNVPFYSSQQSSGISGIIDFDESHEMVGSVNIRPLAEELHELNIENIGVLKIDTEGNDLLVLNGIPWDEVRPELIICEYENNKSKKVGYVTEDMIAYLSGLDYYLVISEWWPIKKYGTKHRWRAFHSASYNLHDNDSWGNIIAFREHSLYQHFINELKNMAIL